MANFPSDSAIKLTAEQEQHIKTLPTSFEIAEYLKTCALDQGLVKRDFDPSILIEVPQPTILTRTITVQGRSIPIEGSSEDELNRIETEVLRQVMAEPAPAATTEQARDANGRFVSQTDAEAETAESLRQEELRLKLLRGELNVDAYIVQSGILDKHIQENYGIQSKHDKNFAAEWEQATQEFLQNSELGKHWPGNTANQKILSDLIQNSNLTDGVEGAENPKLAALELGFQWMIDHDLLVEDESTTHAREIAGANDFESLRRAAQRSIGIPDRPLY